MYSDDTIVYLVLVLMIIVLSHQEKFSSAENDSPCLINLTQISLEFQIFEGKILSAVPHCQPRILMMPDIN